MTRAGLLRAVLAITVLGDGVSAQIKTDIIDQNLAALQKQAADDNMKRIGGTLPVDWNYDLPDGIRTRQVTFYVDGGTPLYGKIFFPRGFSTKGKWPAVAVGHGINALSIGIEKFAARFADRGLVAMAIDYQSYGFSGSGSDDLRLLEADTTNDTRAVWEKESRIQVKRTNLNNAHEVNDFRAAVSFLQGEPGVDPDRIGIWGSSNGGSVVISVAAVDARVKAVVSQVANPRPVPRGPAPLRLPSCSKTASCARAPARAPKPTAASRSRARWTSGPISAIVTCVPDRRWIRSPKTPGSCSCRPRTTSSPARAGRGPSRRPRP